MTDPEIEPIETIYRKEKRMQRTRMLIFLHGTEIMHRSIYVIAGRTC